MEKEEAKETKDRTLKLWCQHLTSAHPFQDQEDKHDWYKEKIKVSLGQSERRGESKGNYSSLEFSQFTTKLHTDWFHNFSVRDWHSRILTVYTTTLARTPEYGMAVSICPVPASAQPFQPMPNQQPTRVKRC